MRIRKTLVTTVVLLFMSLFLVSCTKDSKDFTVTFKDYNGYIISSETINKLENLTIPEIPIRDGYVFTGWDKDLTVISVDTEITAQYSKLSYKIFYKNEEGAVIEEVLVINESFHDIPNAPEVLGKVFIGWEKTINNDTKDITLTALYLDKSYKVFYLDNNGLLLKEILVTNELFVDIPNAPKVLGKSFIGWEKTINSEDGNVTLEATYLDFSYKISYKELDGTLIKEILVENESFVDVPVPLELSGKVFTGWDKLVDELTGNVTLTASYRNVSYKISYKELDGTLIKEVLVVDESFLDIPTAAELEGHTFAGWIKSVDELTNDVILTASYNPKMYELTFLGIDGTVIETTELSYGSEIVLVDAPVIAGYNFVKWDTEDVELLNNLVIKPIYELAGEIKVIFNDILGNEILDLLNNKMSFTIVENINNEITVNGIQVFSGQRFYDLGNYHVVVTDQYGSISEYDIAIKDVNRLTDYNVVYTYATLPTLFATLDIVSNGYPGFVWYGRSNTISNAELALSNDITFSSNIGDPNRLKDYAIRGEGHDYILDILAQDEDAFFHLYVDDFRHWIEFALFSELGLGDHRYEVIYLTDGTYTYTKKYGFMLGDENDYDKFMNVTQARTNLDNKLKNNSHNVSSNGDYLGSWIDHYDDYILAGPIKNNISYWMQYPELLPALDPRIDKRLVNANFKKVLPENMFNGLTTAKQEAFLNIMTIDRDTFITDYFPDPNRKYLMITGTNPASGSLGEAGFINVIDQIIAEFGAEYDLLFKPHPSSIPSPSVQAAVYNKFVAENIKIMPGRLPMEVITWVFPEVALGGFNSSLYMSAPKGNTLFFIMANKNGLSLPMRDLYDGLFSNALFFQPIP